MALIDIKLADGTIKPFRVDKIRQGKTNLKSMVRVDGKTIMLSQTDRLFSPDRSLSTDYRLIGFSYGSTSVLATALLKFGLITKADFQATHEAVMKYQKAREKSEDVYRLTHSAANLGIKLTKAQLKKVAS